MFFTDKSQILLREKEPLQGTIEAGNTIYRVFVEDAFSGIGQYTATTGPDHPSGAGQNVLYGDGSPGTSFNTIRSYTTQTDYVQSSSNSTFTVIQLDPFATTELIGTTGVRTIYELPGSPDTPDKLTITQDVNVSGTTFQNSYIEVTTQITNNNTEAVQVGIRYLWDFEIGSDDGPTFQAINPDGAVFINETQFTPPNFLAYQMVDNDSNPNPPTFIVFGTSTGPTTLVPTPSTPNLLQYGSWPASIGTAFDYTINPNTNVADPPINDSDVLYYFGHNQETAITIMPGASVIRSASLFATKPGVEPPFIDEKICIETTKIYDSCTQEEEKAKTYFIPELILGTVTECTVKHTYCNILHVSEPDSENIVDAQLLVSILVNIKVNTLGRTSIHRRIYSFTKTVRLFAPKGTVVCCEVKNPACDFEQLGKCVRITFHLTVISRSKGIVQVEVPLISLCPPRPCNGSGVSTET